MQKNRIIKMRRKVIRRNQKRIFQIVHADIDCYGEQSGYDDYGNYYSFLTNFSRNRLVAYEEAIKNYMGGLNFAIGTETWGLDEDEYPTPLVDSDMFALYIRGNGDTVEFWNLYDRILFKRFPNCYS